MPNITFYIDAKNTGKDGKAPVKANVCINSKNISKTVAREKYEYWYNHPSRFTQKDKERGIRKKKLPKRNGIELYFLAGSMDDPDYNQERINKTLYNFKKKLSDYLAECETRGIEITPERIKEYFNFRTHINEGPKDFFKAWEEYLDWGKNHKNKKESTTRGIKTTGELLSNFVKDTGYPITFENIDTELYSRIKEYILDEKNYSFNYFASTIRRLKAFLNSDFVKKHYSGTEHRSFKVEEEIGTLVYLTNDELSKLYHHKYKKKKYERVRDLFVFACLTGLRISDWKELNRANVVDDILIRKIKKTGKYVELPLLPEALGIIKKYKHQYHLLPKISEAKFNEYIKEACKKAKIKSLVEYEPKRKGEEKQVFEKWELVSSHVARKTFVTGMIKRGFEIQLIKELATISDERTLKRYLHIDTDLKREKMKQWPRL